MMQKKYKTIVTDPPWKYGKWGKNSGNGIRGDFSGRKENEYDLPYPHMSIDQIKAIPIQELAHENCELYLWTTQKYLPESFDVLKSWGFKYCQTLIWCKTPRGTGQGGIYCPTNEFLILARKGKAPNKKRIDSTWFHIKRPHNSHSTKPEFFQEMIERVTDEPRLEMFARRKREGWDVFGDEVEGSITIDGIA